MKSITKVASICLFLAFVSSTSNAQVGIRAGINASNLSVKNFDDRKTRWGFHAGIYTERLLKGSVYLSPELSVTTKGSSVQYNSSNTTNSFNLNYIELDLPFTYKLNGVDLQAGPYLAYLANANAKSQNETTLIITELNKSNYNNFDAGFLFGLNFRLSNNLYLGARYGVGLVNIARTNAARASLGDARNMVGQLSVSFKL